LKSSFVIQQQILNLNNDCSFFMTVRHIFEISEWWPPTEHTNTHARNRWWTLDFHNAFVSAVEISTFARTYVRNGVSRWLGDKIQIDSSNPTGIIILDHLCITNINHIPFLPKMSRCSLKKVRTYLRTCLAEEKVGWGNKILMCSSMT
jgi:hypothetical protein